MKPNLKHEALAKYITEHPEQRLRDIAVGFGVTYDIALYVQRKYKIGRKRGKGSPAHPFMTKEYRIGIIKRQIARLEAEIAALEASAQ